MGLIDGTFTKVARETYDGPTYHDRPQLKKAPFNAWVVGGYIFLAGLSGGSTLIGAIARADRRGRHASLVRRSRYLALLAPTLGALLLIADLHTPKRFYNMFRVAKKTSPMSIGTWILTSFSVSAGVGALAQAVADRKPRWRWPSRVADGAHIPAAIAGAGLATYTASLLSATSTPLWAAAPRELAARFAASSVASGAAALALGEQAPGTRRALDTLMLVALTTELVADGAATAVYERTGVDAARDSAWGSLERFGASGLGAWLPIGLLIASRLLEDRPGPLSSAAAIAALAGGGAMRAATLGVGGVSAERPKISLGFAQPRNVPMRRG